MAGKRWTEAEDTIIRDHFATRQAADIAALLPGRTTKSVQHRAKTLGLRKTPRDRGFVARLDFERELSAKLGEPVCDWLRRRYVDDQATYRDLNAEIGLNTRFFRS